MYLKRPWFLVCGGALILLFGLGCLNYTKADAWDHHTRQAERYHLPPPSPAIHLAGIIATTIGAGLGGYGLRGTRS
jgi:hypothetical protein